MSTVKLVPNKTASAKAGAPVYYVQSTSGKAFRVQVASTQTVEAAPGFFVTQNRVGFARFLNEEACIAFVTAALANGGNLPGKVVYLDSVTPIVAELPNYGLQYPYPMNFNGKPTELNVRVAIQAKAASTGFTLQHADKDSGELKSIYRDKKYTELDTAKDCILSVDNMDSVNAFIAQTLAAGTGNTAKDRMTALKAIPKAKRTPAETAELAELLEAA